MASLSHDGTLAAAAGGDDNEIHLWKTAEAHLLHRIVGKGKSVWSAGWSADGTTIAWGNTKQGVPRGANMPLERAFNLVNLEFATAPDDSYRRAQAALGSLALAYTGAATVDVSRGDHVVATLKTNLQPERFFCSTLLPGNLAAVGTSARLYLYDAVSGKHIRTLPGHTGPIYAVAPSSDGHFLLSASEDQTLRIWNPERDEPLVSLFFAGNEWIAWVPEGYYAASPGGERLMGWQVDNGPAAMGTFLPAAAFHQSLYRPDLIKSLIRTGSVARGLEVRKETATNVQEVLPPVVVVTSPKVSELKVTEPNLEVSAVARGGSPKHPVRALRLLLDGRPYEGRRGRRRVDPKQETKPWTVQLEPGTHRLVVKAETDASEGRSDEIIVTYEQPRVRTPRLYVLAVGISEYPGTLRLRYADADARAFVEILDKNAVRVFGKVDHKLVLNQEATRSNIMEQLSWLKTQMTSQDVAVIFYAGHGAQDDEGKFCMLSVDADPVNLKSTSVHGDQFKSTLEGIKGRVVVMLDTCHAGALEATGRSRREVRPLTDDLARDLSRDTYGIVVMCSSTGWEFSAEDAKLGHGLFTQALAEGLSGQADYNRDGLVYLTELDAYLVNRVRDLSQDHQHPVMAWPASVLPFVLSRP